MPQGGKEKLPSSEKSRRVPTKYCVAVQGIKKSPKKAKKSGGKRKKTKKAHLLAACPHLYRCRSAWAASSDESEQNTSWWNSGCIYAYRAHRSPVGTEFVRGAYEPYTAE